MADGMRIWQRPLGVACVSGAVALVVVLAILLAQGRGVSGFVHAAPPFTDRSSVRDTLEVLPADEAFDGMFYYRMSVSPFSDAARVAGIVFDTPALRSAWMGYPLLGFVGSVGDPDLVPYALIVVNLLAMFALGWVGGALAMDSGRTAMWGLLLPLFPGFVYTLGFDLTELVTALAVAGAVLALRRRQTLVATLLATYAVLTRETAAVLAIALVMVWLGQLVRDRSAAARGSPPTKGRQGAGGIAMRPSWLLLGLAGAAALGMGTGACSNMADDCENTQCGGASGTAGTGGWRARRRRSGGGGTPADCVPSGSRLGRVCR